MSEIKLSESVADVTSDALKLAVGHCIMTGAPESVVNALVRAARGFQEVVDRHAASSPSFLAEKSSDRRTVQN